MDDQTLLCIMVLGLWVFFLITNLLKTFCIFCPPHCYLSSLLCISLSSEGVFFGVPHSPPCIQERICLITRTGTDCLPTADFMTFISSGNFLAVVTLCIVEHPFPVYLLSRTLKNENRLSPLTSDHEFPLFLWSTWVWFLISIPSHICVPPNTKLQFYNFCNFITLPSRS